MQQIASLFDHLVGAGDERRRHLDAKSLGSFAIDPQRVFCGGLGQVRRFLAFENAVDVASGAPVGVDSVRSIGHQPTVGDIDPERIDGGQSAAGPRERQLTRDARELP